MRQPVNWIVDLDLAQFFDTMPHQESLTVLAQRITDTKFLRLTARMRKAGVKPQAVLCKMTWEALRAPSCRQ